MANDQSTDQSEQKECLHCGTETTQRADGKPYCSMDCINSRRRERDNEALACPYPDCDWKVVYDPENGLSRAVAYHEAETHRQEHRESLNQGGESDV